MEMVNEDQSHKMYGNNQPEIGTKKSEFIVVVGSQDKVSSNFGSNCISHIDDLNKRMSSSVGQLSELNDNLSGDESEGEKSKRIKDIREHNYVHFRKSTTMVKSNFNYKKPLLVELHLFPGFDSEKQTALPSNLSTLFILNVITEAKVDIQRKPAYKKQFKDFFLSSHSQKVFQDTFWWYFCHKYQSSGDVQDKLFDRIAINYTNLLLNWSGSKYQDKLYNDYADLVSQAVYSTFCHAFPASYLQFNAEFCDDVLSLINLWMMGTKPAPRSWDKWNFEGIEPKRSRKGESIIENLERVDSIESRLDMMDENLPSPSPLIRNRSGGRSKRKHVPSALRFFEKAEKKNSIAANGGPLFHKVVFNLLGRSPLIEHFLSSHNLCKDAGTSVLVQRTEIEALPPLCAETYRDVIHSVRSRSRQSLEDYRVKSAHRQKEHQDMKFNQKLDHENFKYSSEKLLSSPYEVHKLCELLRTSENKEE